MTRAEAEYLIDNDRATAINILMRVSALEKELAELKARLNLNSGNSGKPPSSDGLKKKALSLSAVEAKIREKRQVFDIPQPHLICTEYQMAVKTCPCCNMIHAGSFPEGVETTVQYGENLRTNAIYLSVQQLVPLNRVCQALNHLCGAQISDTTLMNWLALAYEKLSDFEIELKSKLLEASVAHADETGFRIEKLTQWLHVFSTRHLTWYGYHRNRGSAAHLDHELLPNYQGQLVADSYQAYQNGSYDLNRCHEHHRRELVGIRENDPQNKEWALEMLEWLFAAKSVRDYFLTQADWIPERIQKMFVGWFHAHIKKGIAQNPAAKRQESQRGKVKQSKAYNLIHRFSNWESACLGFIRHRAVPFDNNLAERDLRMMKVKSKVSGCFRTDSGASQFCRLRSFISTARKLNQNIYDWLQQIWNGRPERLLEEIPRGG